MRALSDGDLFQHTAARRRLDAAAVGEMGLGRFNTQPPEGGWFVLLKLKLRQFVSTHSRPKAAGLRRRLHAAVVVVSTHSRPKAAGIPNHQVCLVGIVSTHSRPKAAGYAVSANRDPVYVSTHSRPKAAGSPRSGLLGICPVSTHSRPKAAGSHRRRRGRVRLCFNTQPPEGGWVVDQQYIAADYVSTHSRPKAAGCGWRRNFAPANRFNTQPPEGGWSLSQKPCPIRFRSPDFAKLSRKA